MSQVTGRHELSGNLPTPGPDTGAHLLERYTGALMNTFGRPQRVLVRGAGCHVWDADGGRYLDLLGGIAVNALGHAHPTLIATVTAQLSTLGHISNFFTSGPQIALAERLLELTGAPAGSRVFFASTGTEAVEAAFKLSRRTGRTAMVAAEGAFHGRTMGALALTHKPAYRQPFEPLPGTVVHVPYGDEQALTGAVDAGVAAVVLEPIQGEAGVRMPPGGYLAHARQVTRQAGALLILDEVQTGIGRTGSWLAHTDPAVGGPDVQPDVVTLAKGLGSGMPVGALIGFGDAGALLTAGQHGTTFGGNPVACAAGLATLHVIERDGLLERVTALGQRWRADLLDADDLVVGTRGRGLLIGIHLARPVAAAFAAAALDAGFIVNAPAPDTIRLAPPLILDDAQADSFTEAVPALCRAALADEVAT